MLRSNIKYAKNIPWLPVNWGLSLKETLDIQYFEELSSNESEE